MLLARYPPVQQLLYAAYMISVGTATALYCQYDILAVRNVALP